MDRNFMVYLAHRRPSSCNTGNSNSSDSASGIVAALKADTGPLNFSLFSRRTQRATALFVCFFSFLFEKFYACWRKTKSHGREHIIINNFILSRTKFIPNNSMLCLLSVRCFRSLVHVPYYLYKRLLKTPSF